MSLNDVAPEKWDKMREAVNKCVRDNVNPSHYKDTYPFEVIDLIEDVLTPEQFEGYCLGNELKYRMRAGLKDPASASEDIQKALWYYNKRKDS